MSLIPKGETINSEAYCETLQHLRRAIQNKSLGMLLEKVLLIHNNARPHITLVVILFIIYVYFG